MSSSVNLFELIGVIIIS